MITRTTILQCLRTIWNLLVSQGEYVQSIVESKKSYLPGKIAAACLFASIAGVSAPSKAHDHHEGLNRPEISAIPRQKVKNPRAPQKKFVVTDERAFVANVCKLIEEAALRQKLPPGFLAKLIWKESRFDPNAISPVGAEGIAQFMPFTADAWGLRNSFDPQTAIDASSRLLGYLSRGYGNLGLAAAAYNAGEGRVDRWRSGKSGLPAETQDYVYSITGHRAKEWARAPYPNPGFVLDEVVPFQRSCTQFPIVRAPLQRRFANTYYNRGLRLSRKKDYANAINRYSVAIRLKPNFPHAYNNRGIVFRKIGDYETAIANYDAAIKQKPDYAAAYNNRGYAKRKLKRYEEALQDYEKALKYKSNYTAAYFNRGVVKAKLGKHQAAIVDYTTALKFNSKHALALFHRGRSRLELGKKAAAEADFNRAIAAKPKFAVAYFVRATLLHSQGKKQRARKDYQKSVALNPTFAKTRYKKYFR